MRIYTRKGDRGETGLLGAGRVSKADARIRALGSLDEVNAALGMLLAAPDCSEEFVRLVRRVQITLLEAGADLARSPDATGQTTSPPEESSRLLISETAWLEAECDRLTEMLPPLTRFILPGGGSLGSGLHWVRTLVRRAETQVVEAVGSDPRYLPLLGWLNRLSDTLFLLARQANLANGVAETVWESAAGRRKDKPVEGS